MTKTQGNFTNSFFLVELFYNFVFVLFIVDPLRFIKTTSLLKDDMGLLKIESLQCSTHAALLTLSFAKGTLNVGESQGILLCNCKNITTAELTCVLCQQYVHFVSISSPYLN